MEKVYAIATARACRRRWETVHFPHMLRSERGRAHIKQTSPRFVTATRRHRMFHMQIEHRIGISRGPAVAVRRCLAQVSAAELYGSANCRRERKVLTTTKGRRYTGIHSTNKNIYMYTRQSHFQSNRPRYHPVPLWRISFLLSTSK